MAQYRVVETSFIDNKLCAEGTIVEYDPGKDGKVGDNLEPVKKAKADKAEVSDDKPEGDQALA
jgi:hypothetical protein